MLPTVKPKDRLVVQKIWFFCNIQQNNIIALRDPQTKKLMVKRVKEMRNYDPEEEKHFYPNKVRTSRFGRRIQTFLIHDKKYFVLGDNPPESTDSRTFGWVREKNIVGKVIYQINL